MAETFEGKGTTTGPGTFVKVQVVENTRGGNVVASQAIFQTDVLGEPLAPGRLAFGAPLLSNQGAGAAQTAWVSCVARAIVRVKVDYLASTGDRGFVLLYRDTADVPCAGSGVFTPENTAVETATSSGKYHGGTYFAFDCRGMKDFAVAVLAGSVNVDVYGAAS